MPHATSALCTMFAAIAARIIAISRLPASMPFFPMRAAILQSI